MSDYRIPEANSSDSDENQDSPEFYQHIPLSSPKSECTASTDAREHEESQIIGAMIESKQSDASYQESQNKTEGKKKKETPQNSGSMTSSNKIGATEHLGRRSIIDPHRNSHTSQKQSQSVEVDSSSSYQNQDSPQSESGVSRRNWLIVFFIPVIVSLLAIYFARSTLLSSSNEIIEEDLREQLDFLRSSFPSQRKKTWDVFEAALTSIEGSPSQPAVLLMVSINSTAAAETRDCLAKKLADVTNKLFNASPYGSTQVNVEEISSDDEHMLKKELDNQIRSILSRSGSYAAIISNIQNIPPEAAMLLHGYCDNFEAPFKQRIIMLTIDLGEERSLNFNEVISFLHELWNPELGEDKAGALIGRIATSPIFINPENRLPCPVEIY